MTPRRDTEPRWLVDHAERIQLALGTRRATTRLARRLGAALAEGDLIVLSGGLGVGKTFFVRALARGQGVTGRITSPSYALVHHLEGRAGAVPLVHADLYRLEHAGPAAIHELGLHELRETAALLVEWGRPHHEALGGRAIELRLAHDGEHGRTVDLMPLDDRTRFDDIARCLRAARANPPSR
ncbi:MAG: tRNA (adenosine(37)-N6)-threonylcarbamoyltransferase complex ATPase subunit type 1 TsaE [Myxococcota bacterium]